MRPLCFNRNENVRLNGLHIPTRTALDQSPLLIRSDTARSQLTDELAAVSSSSD
jgi:hypothetical protein